MNKGLIITFLLCLGMVAQAQNYLLLKGQTRDSTLAPIAFANVMLIDTATQEMKAFAVTDVKGNFQVRLEKGKAYELQVTFVGFVPYRQVISLDQTPEGPIIIRMKEAVNALEEVTVVAEMPVVVRGDTISYKAEAFTKGDERKLEDVLAELPGFDVKENGDIEVQGKRVEKVMVNGKEFFEGDTKLASKNIPADVVDRVQVLQNFNDITPMQGLMDDDRLALNIELKGDRERMVFGDVEAGGGPEDRYFGHANTFYYAPKTSLNFIGDANNVGELALSMNDYFRMSGGLSSLSSRNGTTIRMNAADANIPVTDRNTASDLTNQLGALNFTTRISDKLQLSGFAIGFDNDVSLSSNSLRTYPQLDDQTQEELDTRNRINTLSGLGRFAAKYTPSYNMQLDYSFFGKRSSIDQSFSRNSRLISGDNRLQEDNDLAPGSQNHQLRIFNALNKKNIISAELGYQREENVNGTILTSEQALFTPFLPFTNPAFSLNQAQTINSEQLDGAFNYYHILNKTTHLNAAFGVNLSEQRLTNNLGNDGNASIDVNQNLTINNRYVRLQYKKKWNKLTLSPGVSFNSYTIKSVSETSENTQYVFPQLRAIYDFGSSHSIQLNYRQSIEFNEVAAYAEEFRLDRYNALQFGNGTLAPALYNTFNLVYRNFDMYNFFNIHGAINFQYIKDGFINDQQLAGVENVYTAVNASAANRILNGYINLEKRFNHLRVSGSVNLSQTVLNNQFENQEIENDNFTQKYNLSMSARLFKKFSIRTGYTVSINTYSSGPLTSTFVNYQPNVSTTLKIKGFRLDTDYSFNRYVNRNQNQETSFDVLDASLSYRNGKSPWEFKLQGLNLLDTRSVRRDSFSNNLISTYSYSIQQRYGLFTIMYDI